MEAAAGTMQAADAAMERRGACVQADAGEIEDGAGAAGRGGGAARRREEQQAGVAGGAAVSPGRSSRPGSPCGRAQGSGRREESEQFLVCPGVPTFSTAQNTL